MIASLPSTLAGKGILLPKPLRFTMSPANAPSAEIIELHCVIVFLIDGRRLSFVVLDFVNSVSGTAAHRLTAFLEIGAGFAGRRDILRASLLENVLREFYPVGIVAVH